MSARRASAPSKSPVGRRIQDVREASGLGQIDFAARLGISRSALGRYERGERVPDAAAAARLLLEHFGASRDWLYDGIGAPPPLLAAPPPPPLAPVYVSPPRGDEGPILDEAGERDLRATLIASGVSEADYLAARAVAVESVRKREEGPYRKFPAKTWIPLVDAPGTEAVSRVSLDPKTMAVMESMGVQEEHLAAAIMPDDTMLITLCPGDIALLDRRYTAITKAGLWAVEVNGTVMLRRVQLEPNGDLTLIPDNNKYRPTTLSPDQVRVVGLMMRKHQPGWTELI